MLKDLKTLVEELEKAYAMNEGIEREEALLSTHVNLKQAIESLFVDNKEGEVIDNFVKLVLEFRRPKVIPGSFFSDLFGYDLSKQDRIVPRHIRRALRRRGVYMRRIRGTERLEVWTDKTEKYRIIRGK